MKKVIFNADDLGFSPETNKAIIESCDKGVVRSCSLFVNLPYTEDGVKLAKEAVLDVGLHLNLAVGESLTDSKSLTKGGEFHGGYEFLIRYFFGMIKKEDVEREIRAQIEKFKELGFALNHIDSHLHFHCLPKIYDIVLKLANEYNIKKIRLPRYSSSFSLRALFVLLIGKFCKEDKRSVKTVIGLSNIMGKLKFCKKGVTELMVHPSYDAKIYRKGYSELRILVSGNLKEKIREKGILVISFGDLISGEDG